MDNINIYICIYIYTNDIYIYIYIFDNVLMCSDVHSCVDVKRRVCVEKCPLAPTAK